ncbi:hypothetical protein G159_07745 [Planococcus glaciei CHR43]|nr:hypothetical protein G159_07745 [Planococcus glaciei CHR43]
MVEIQAAIWMKYAIRFFNFLMKWMAIGCQIGW